MRHVCTDRGLDDESQAAAGLASAVKSLTQSHKGAKIWRRCGLVLARQVVYLEAAAENRQGLAMARCTMYCTLRRSESSPISRSRRGRRRARRPK